MNYIDVARMMKQAALGSVPAPKAPDNTFSNGIAAAQRQRQAQIQNANRTYQQTTGKAPMTNVQSNQVLDDFARQRAQQAAAARKAQNARSAAFRQGQQAQAQTRADRVNKTIAAQPARDKAFRDSQRGVMPKAEPPAVTQPAVNGTRQARINAAKAQAAKQDAAIAAGTFKPQSGYANIGGVEYGTRKDPGVRTINHGQTMLGAKSNGVKERKTAQGYRTPDGVWHPL